MTKSNHRRDKSKQSEAVKESKLNNTTEMRVILKHGALDIVEEYDKEENENEKEKQAWP